MFKKLTAMLTVGCMMALCLTPGGYAQERIGSAPISADAINTKGKDGTISFEISGDGTMTISGNAAIADYDVLSGTSAPWTKYSPTKIVIQEGITGVGSEAFSGMTSIASVSIPSSVKYIGEYAFHNCSSLQQITIPNSISKINSSTFENCTSLTSITIPDSVTLIDEYAFNRCSSLQNVTIPASVSRINRCAFNKCTELKSVTIQNPSCVIYNEG